MTTSSPKRPAAEPNRSVLEWLLDSDPAIRWQVLRDLIGAPAEEIAAERARVASAGLGAWLLALPPCGCWTRTRPAQVRNLHRKLARGY
jgi:hypothetical protein